MIMDLKTDVVVAGAGCAGCIAAIAAAMRGASVVLIEKLPHPGGNSTAVLDTFYAFHMAGEAGAKIVAGIPDLPVDKLRERNKVFARPNSFGSGIGYTYDPDYLRIVWARLLRDAGVKVLCHSLLQSAEVSQDGRITSVLIATKSGQVKISASNFVDTTGDADLIHGAGGSFQSDQKFTQSSTMTFRMSGVDIETFKSEGRPRYRELVENARRQGLNLPGNGGSLHQTVGHEAVLTAMIRVDPPDLGDPFDLTRVEFDALDQVERWVDFLVEYMPGFESAKLSAIGTMSGIRETRRVLGQNTLSEEHVLEGLGTANPVALCGAPVEDLTGQNTRWSHVGGDGYYAIDWACLQPMGLTNVAVAGRCLSASHEAHASARSMATCMAMGQAAGTAAALAGERTTISEFSYAILREALLSDGAILEVA